MRELAIMSKFLSGWPKMMVGELGEGELDGEIRYLIPRNNPPPINPPKSSDFKFKNCPLIIPPPLKILKSLNI